MSYTGILLDLNRLLILCGLFDLVRFDKNWFDAVRSYTIPTLLLHHTPTQIFVRLHVGVECRN